MQDLLENIKTLKNRMVCRKVENEMVLVPLVNNVAEMKVIYTLNEVASFIWEKIDYINSVDELAKEVVATFEVELKTAQNDISEFFNTLLETNN